MLNSFFIIARLRWHVNRKIVRFSYIIFSLIVIFAPVVLENLQSIFNFNFDTKLIGFTIKNNKPQRLSYNDFKSGKFQTNYSSWYNDNLPLRGHLVKCYNTIRFKLFHLANLCRLIGNDNFVYEPAYLNAHFVLSEKYDFSIKKNKMGMQEFVNDLVTLQEKLDNMGKTLYIFIPPSKVHFYPQSVPNKFYNMKDEHAISPLTMFKNLVDKTNLNVRIATYDMQDNYEYPSFYSTGIHWSRTYEQIATDKMLEDINNISGRHYRRLVFGKVKKNKKGFWRDKDVYNALNIYDNKKNEKYYEFKLKREKPQEYDKMRFLINGDSFSEGLIHDILKIYPDEKFIVRVNRDVSVTDGYNNRILLNHDFNNADFGKYLNASDVVIIEMIEPEILYYSHGFVKHLLRIIDNDSEVQHGRNKDNKNTKLIFDDNIDYENSLGLYNKYRRGIWTNKYASINMTNKYIGKKGFKIDFKIPNQIIEKHKTQNVVMYINQEKVYEKEFNKPGLYTFQMSPKDINITKDDTYEVVLELSHIFIPKNFNKKSNDSRKLGVLIKYIGEVR